MPTLSASPRARLAAIERGLAVQTEANRTLVSEVRTLAAPKPDVRSPDNGPAEPSNKPRKRTEYREQQQQARERLWPLLHECFPEAFSLPARPLAIGVHREILAVAGDSVDPHELSIFMRYWVSRWSYLRAVHVGAPRVNLDGSVAGVPTLEQRNQAGRALWGERYQEIKEATAVDVKEAEMEAS